MNYTTFLVANVVSILCVLASVLLVLKQREGWGWFLFVAVLTFTGTQAVTRTTTDREATETASRAAEPDRNIN